MEEVKTNVKYQYLAGICVNIISLSYGAFCGWTSPAFPVLQANDSPLETGPMSASDAGWVGAMMCVGGALGAIVFTWSAEKIGRRKSLMLTAIPAAIGWLIIPFSQNPAQLCISRFVGGFAGGGSFAVIPTYLTEIADNNLRGILGTFLIFFVNIGILVAFVLGYFFYYTTVAWIMLVPILIYICSFPFLPETPQHLIRKNKLTRAERSFCYFRNVNTAVPELPEHFRTELEKLKSSESIDPAVVGSIPSLKWKDFFNPLAMKALLLGVYLMSLNVFCGSFGMINYTATIFAIAKSSLSPNMCAIFVGVIQLAGSYFSTLLVQSLNRKTLLIISSIGTALGEVGLGTYVYLEKSGFDTQPYSWIPLVSFSFTILMSCVGILPLSFVLLSELMPPKIRSVGCMFCMVCIWMFAFLMLKILPFLMVSMGLDGMVYMFGIYCLASIPIVLIFIPETKGKSIEEIMASL